MNILHFLIHSFLDGHLGCFFFWVFIMDNAAINICMQHFVWTYVCISIGYVPMSEIAESYGYSIFNHLKNCLLFPKRVLLMLLSLYIDIHILNINLMWHYYSCFKWPMLCYMHTYLTYLVFFIILSCFSYLSPLLSFHWVMTLFYLQGFPIINFVAWLCW